MTATSSVPAAIDGLLAVARAAVAADVQVTDGPIFDSAVPVNQVFIGAGVVDNGEDSNAATGRQMNPYLGNRRWAEDYTIACAVSSYDGASQKAARDAAYTVFEQIRAAVAADYTLGGALSGRTGWALVQDVALDQTVPDDAESRPYFAFIAFNVHVYNQIT